jgi:hypothetical protein
MNHIFPRSLEAYAASAAPLAVSPDIVRDGESGPVALLKVSHGSPIRRSLKRLKLRQIFDDKRPQRCAVRQAEAPKSLPRGRCLEDALRKNKAQLAPYSQIFFRRHVCHEHRNVVAGSIRDCVERLLPFGKEVIPLPKRQPPGRSRSDRPTRFETGPKFGFRAVVLATERNVKPGPCPEWS